MHTRGSESNRGQVGIGTLIVFVAMILVAALTAGILVHSIGLLQTQAEATGEGSTEQVSMNLEVVGATGTIGSGGDSVNETRLVTQLGAGSGDIDLSKATVQVIGPEGASTLVANEGSKTSGSEFGLEAVTGDTDAAVLQDRSDRIAIVVDLEELDAAGDSGLEAGEQAQVTITLSSGGQTTTAIRVPDVLTQKDAGDNVRL